MAIVVGVDENGLGPRLGPLVVTAAPARADGDQAVRVASSRPRGKLRERLGDSKTLVSYEDSSLGEAWARALVPEARNPQELVAALSVDADDVLRALCPPEHVDQCWGAGEAFRADDTALAEVARDLERLGRRGVRLGRPRVAVICSRRINDAAAKGLSRLEVDLHAMERLLLSVRESAGEEIVAVCGKVGGYDFYERSFGPLSGRLRATLEEGRERSAYRFPGIGEIAFVRDADARHLLVCLASLVGKWVRDLLMARIVRYHRAYVPDLPDASGYHDPVTARFIAKTRLVRRKRNLPDTCFERVRVDRAVLTPRSTPEPSAPVSDDAPPTSLRPRSEPA
jgi:ribonuclease HII